MRGPKECSVQAERGGIEGDSAEAHGRWAPSRGLPEQSGRYRGLETGPRSSWSASQGAEPHGTGAHPWGGVPGLGRPVVSEGRVGGGRQHQGDRHGIFQPPPLCQHRPPSPRGWPQAPPGTRPWFTSCLHSAEPNQGPSRPPGHRHRHVGSPFTGPETRLHSHRWSWHGLGFLGTPYWFPPLWGLGASPQPLCSRCARAPGVGLGAPGVWVLPVCIRDPSGGWWWGVATVGWLGTVRAASREGHPPGQAAPEG